MRAIGVCWSSQSCSVGFAVIAMTSVSFLLHCGGCSPPCFENFGFVPWVDVRGTVLDEATGVPLVDVDVGIALFDDKGEGLANLRASRIGQGGMFQTRDDGSFVIMSDRSTTCITVIGVVKTIPLPVVARMEITVFRETCESRFAFDVNEANIVDPSAPDGLLELREPIVVSECVP